MRSFGGPRCHSIYRYQNDEQAYRKQLEKNQKFKSHWTMENASRANEWMNELKTDNEMQTETERFAREDRPKNDREEKQEQRFSFRPTDWLTAWLTS